MIENLLVDPKVIWEAITLTLHKTTFEKLDDVENALDRILDDLEQHEIDRRIKDKVGYFPFRAKDPLDNLQRQVAEHVDTLKAATAEATIAELRSRSTEEVAGLKRQESRRENYSGQEILKRFYDAHLNN